MALFYSGRFSDLRVVERIFSLFSRYNYYEVRE